MVYPALSLSHDKPQSERASHADHSRTRDCYAAHICFNWGGCCRPGKRLLAEAQKYWSCYLNRKKHNWCKAHRGYLYLACWRLYRLLLSSSPDVTSLSKAGATTPGVTGRRAVFAPRLNRSSTRRAGDVCLPPLPLFSMEQFAPSSTECSEDGLLAPELMLQIWGFSVLGILSISAIC